MTLSLTKREKNPHTTRTSTMHKRKHRKSFRDDNWDPSQTRHAKDHVPAPDPILYIQAHEADIIRGSAASAAHALEYLASSGDHSRSGLIQWGPEHPYTSDPHAPNKPHVWVDRYDVRLLLDNLPDVRSETTCTRPPSPSGWSDLPSDSEDTFFFSPDELEDYRREKRRKLIDRGREERLKALLASEGPEEDPDPWGGSDEEPDEAQKELIRRTAAHVMASPNPGQLEMRILANYGTDKRFAFLRGRWSRVWRREKERAKQHQAENAVKSPPSTALTSLGGLASYGDSDTDGEEPEIKPLEEPEGAMDGHGNEDDIKAARRARAREWSARRRAGQSSQSEDS